MLILVGSTDMLAVLVMLGISSNGSNGSSSGSSGSGTCLLILHLFLRLVLSCVFRGYLSVFGCT